MALKKPAAYARACLTACRCLVCTREVRAFKHLAKAACLVHHLLPGRGIHHLHAHFAHSPTSVAMFAGLLSGLPFSFTAHAVDIYTSDPWLLQEKIRSAAYVVTCTEYNRRYLAELAGGVPPPIRRIYHGIDLQYFSQWPASRTPGPPYRILTVARLVEKKGLPTVYRALRLLRDQGPDFTHVLIGDGQDRLKILSLIEELGLGDVARCIGLQSHEVVRQHYREADLFVLGCEVAANGDRDGLPNVLLEAMAMEVPVVATDVSAIPELVEDGLTGLLVKPGDSTHMAEAMARMLTDLDFRAKVVARAREKVAGQFGAAAAIRELAELHGRALATGPGHNPSPGGP